MDLGDIHIGLSTLTDSVYIGTLEKDKVSWRNKIDRTNEFLTAVIQRWCGFKQTITQNNGKRYEVYVKELK